MSGFMLVPAWGLWASVAASVLCWHLTLANYMWLAHDMLLYHKSAPNQCACSLPPVQKALCNLVHICTLQLFSQCFQHASGAVSPASAIQVPDWSLVLEGGSQVNVYCFGHHSDVTLLAQLNLGCSTLGLREEIHVFLCWFGASLIYLDLPCRDRFGSAKRQLAG